MNHILQNKIKAKLESELTNIVEIRHIIRQFEPCQTSEDAYDMIKHYFKVSKINLYGNIMVYIENDKTSKILPSIAILEINGKLYQMGNGDFYGINHLHHISTMELIHKPYYISRIFTEEL